MSYNISSYKTKACNLTIEGGLEVMVNLLNTFEIEIRLIKVEPGRVNYNATGCSEGFYMEGWLDNINNIWHITDLRDYGEGSGGCHDLLTSFLETTRGNLEMVLVWEGGDSITRLIVNNDLVTEEEIEL
jgi:hypothetical protein